jgi:UDPglucose 6-dehydrogenase
MRIAVIGTGHVGLVASAGLSEFGNDVECVGLAEEDVNQLTAGGSAVFEPGLSALMASNVEGGRLLFTTDLEGAVKRAEVIVIAIRTPMGQDGTTDLTELFSIADRIGKSLDSYKVIATKSTVPVGTADRLGVRIGAHGSVPFSIASNPSFLKEGDAVHDFMKPARVVIGTGDARAEEVLRRLYAPFVRTSDRILVVDARTAELAKYAASALLATRISFMNELALLADEVGADIELVRGIIGADPRIGPKSLFVGPGFGGTDFQNDISMLLSTARQASQQLAVVTAANAANQRQKAAFAERLARELGDLEGKTIAVWGLAFKPRTNDIGEAPAVALIDDLLEHGAQVRAHDPQALDNARAHYGDRVYFADTMYDACKSADALVLVTEWHQYRRPDFTRIAGCMHGKLLLDGRNVWDKEELREKGLRYIGIGRS